jgi:hypothetical protein
VDCGDWARLCAKDEQHTLYDDVGLEVVGTEYSTPALDDLFLEGGDTDNDSDVDDNDVGWLMYQWQLLGGSARPGGCSWDGTRDADFDNNGVTLTNDYTILSWNWHQFSSCECVSGAGATAPNGDSRETLAAMVQTSQPVSELPAVVRESVDLNRDGVFDHRDVREFERLHGLPDTLSSKMEASALEAPDS